MRALWLHRALRVNRGWGWGGGGAGGVARNTGGDKKIYTEHWNFRQGPSVGGYPLARLEGDSQTSLTGHGKLHIHVCTVT